MNTTLYQIPFLSADATTQMALDSELAELCNRTPGLAFCRFYQMNPPAVTIGRNQAWKSVIDESFLRRRGFDWARRPTGGGALLHHREINYAVVAAFDAIEPTGHRNFRRVFEKVMTGIVGGLETLGLRPNVNLGRETGGEVSAESAHGLCERSLTRYEIEIDGKKAVAAAQRNLANAFLQHGTIYLVAPQSDDRFWENDRSLAPEDQGSRWWGFDSQNSLSDVGIDPITAAIRDGIAERTGSGCEPATRLPVEPDQLELRKRSWEQANWNRTR